MATGRPKQKDLSNRSFFAGGNPREEERSKTLLEVSKTKITKNHETEALQSAEVLIWQLRRA